MDEELRVTLCDRGHNLLQDLARCLVIPIVEHGVEVVGFCAFDRLRSEEIMRTQFDALLGMSDLCDDFGSILQTQASR